MDVQKESANDQDGCTGIKEIRFEHSSNASGWTKRGGNSWGGGNSDDRNVQIKWCQIGSSDTPVRAVGIYDTKQGTCIASTCGSSIASNETQETTKNTFKSYWSSATKSGSYWVVGVDETDHKLQCSYSKKEVPFPDQLKGGYAYQWKPNVGGGYSARAK